MREVNEKDWKLFRKKVSTWQENYMDKLNKEYIEILSRKESPSTNFWDLEERIKKDKKSKGVLIRMSKSEMFKNILLLLKDEVITVDDLEEFSEELQEDVKYVLRRF